MLHNLLRRGGASDDPGEAGAAARRPTIALALGGGAARGFAHIGVMRVLLQHGIVPDILVGTSIGAVVAGCHIAGKLDELEDWARGLALRSVLGYLDVSLAGSGLITGARLAGQLEKHLGRDILIDDLPAKFAAIATEISTGHEIWLTRGRLVDAIRASYALPGIFAPVLIGNRWLVDGALVNPVPVSAARALGADVVIAVNVSADVFAHGTTIAAHGADIQHVPEREAPPAPPKSGIARLLSVERTVKRNLLGTPDRPGLSTIMVEAFNVMQDRITRARLAGDPPDVLITPRIRNVGWFDFHRAADTIECGRVATVRAMEAIEEAVGIRAATGGCAERDAASS